MGLHPVKNTPKISCWVRCQGHPCNLQDLDFLCRKDLFAMVRHGAYKENPVAPVMQLPTSHRRLYVTVSLQSPMLRVSF